MKLEKRSLLPIGLFLLYTFSITWFCWSIIIIGNRYFNTLWYGEPLSWIPYTIGGLGLAISSYLIHRQCREHLHSCSLKYNFSGLLIPVPLLLTSIFLGISQGALRRTQRARLSCCTFKMRISEVETLYWLR